MPSTHTALNASAVALVAGDLVELLPEDPPPAPPPVDFRRASATGRPFGIAVAAIPGNTAGSIYLSGIRSGLLAAEQTVQVGDRLISAGSGQVAKAPAGYSGWIVGVAAEAKTTTAVPQAISVRLAPRPV